jgi:hypothetical protein
MTAVSAAPPSSPTRMSAPARLGLHALLLLFSTIMLAPFVVMLDRLADPELSLSCPRLLAREFLAGQLLAHLRGGALWPLLLQQHRGRRLRDRFCRF